MALNVAVIEDDCYFLGVHIRLFFGCTYKTPCNISFTLALKLTDLWITSLLFDLNYKFIKGRFAISPG